MSVTKLLTSQFNGDGVVAHFNLGRDQMDERNAMRFVYDIIYAESNERQDKLTRSRLATAAAIKEIEFPYNVCEKYAEDFFGTTNKYNKGAVILAVICGKHLEKANEALPQTQEEIDADAPVKFPGEYLDNSVLQDAIEILEEADSLMSGGWFNPDKEPFTESFFVAHIMAMEKLYDFEMNFEAYTRDEIEKFSAEDLMSIDAFSQAHTQIGALLEEYVRIAWNKIDDLKQKAYELKPTKYPHLSVVVNNPAPHL